MGTLLANVPILQPPPPQKKGYKIGTLARNVLNVVTNPPYFVAYGVR